MVPAAHRQGHGQPRCRRTGAHEIRLGASRANYAAQLVCERLTGEKAETYTNAAMQWGTDTEPHARAAYEFRTDNAVELVGFIDHPRIAMSGASPDGLVGADGMVEIKCPASSTHIETLLGSTIPERYRLQMTWQLACTERRFCDFVSFDPRLPEHMRMFVQRFEPTPPRCASLRRRSRPSSLRSTTRLPGLSAPTEGKRHEARQPVPSREGCDVRGSGARLRRVRAQAPPRTHGR